MSRSDHTHIKVAQPSFAILLMMLRLDGLLLLTCLVLFARGLDVKGSIKSNTHLLSPALLPLSSLIILSSPNYEYRTHPSPNGKFSFYNISTIGNPSYLLQVECISHKFPQLRVDIEEQEIAGVYYSSRKNKWSHKGSTLSYPIELAATGKAEFYVVCLH